MTDQKYETVDFDVRLSNSSQMDLQCFHLSVGSSSRSSLKFFISKSRKNKSLGRTNWGTKIAISPWTDGVSL